jgi:2-methylcitrate dehydratase PrpD
MLTSLVCQLQSEVIPPEIYSFGQQCVLDYLGVTVAGAHDLRDKLCAYLDGLPDRGGTASVIGLGRRASLADAALLNGIAAHYFELDDGSRFAMVHLAAPVLSALFPVAQAYGLTPERFLRSVIVGYDTTLRLAAAIQPAHKKKGFHATGTCGCIGAAAAVAVALGYDREKIRDTLAAAAASACGLLEMIESGSQLKPFNAGKAAQNAVTAAFVGGAGFSGPADPIGGKRGILGAMGQELDESWFEREGDRRYAIVGIYRKPYASCRHCHSPVEAALTLGQRDAIDCDSIRSIQVDTYGLAVFGHDHRQITGVSDAKMSIPYSVAAALVLGDGGMRAMSETAVRDERILALAQRVSVREEPAYSALAPGKRIAALTVTTADGKEHTCQVTYPKGEPENPMTEQELTEKFTQLAMYGGLSPEQCAQIQDAVTHLGEKFDQLLKIIESI